MKAFLGFMWMFLTLTWAARFPGGVEREPSETYTAIQGGKVALPCDIMSPMVGDEVYLVLWYKDDIATPIYSLDSRRGQVVQARHSSSDTLTRRAYFNTIPKPAILEIGSLADDDEGDYRCRVDFQKAQTRHYQVALKILVPPGKPEIRNSSGTLLHGTIGPYNEGDSLYLLCESKGGKPPPAVTWWRASKMVDDTYDVVPSSNVVQNELLVETLTRRDLMAHYSCRASNTNISDHASTTVSLDLNFKPLLVKISGQRQSISAGRSAQLRCTAQGSRPPAQISWRKGGTKFKDAQEDVITRGNVTVSVFTFTPSSEDHSRLIECYASNPLIPGSMLEDGWKLDVRFVPQLNLRLGNKLRHSNILEGNDVYFECTIRANPWVTETSWKFAGQELQTNISAGVIVSNQSLVLQKVRRANRGRYICTGTNSEGLGESNHVYLRVQYAPVCRPGQQTMYGAMLHYPVEIACEVESDPDDVDFRWEFNSSTGTLELVPTMTTGRKSVVHYIPRSDHDYGTLSCWGRNKVGLQKTPCLFVVIPAEPPSTVHNCTMSSETERSFRVSCYEGKDGGLVQFFQMEVRTSDSTLLLNLSSQTADFSARGLSPGSVYTVTLYSVNAKGRSRPVTLKAATLATPESQTRKEDLWELSLSPILLILLAVAGGIALVAISIIVYLKVHKRRRVRKDNLHAEQTKSCSCSDLGEKVCRHCLCEKSEEEKSKQLLSESYVVLESAQPDVTCGDISSRKDAVCWRRSPVTPPGVENHINPCLSIKLPFHRGSSESNRLRSPLQGDTLNCANSILLHHRPGDDHTSSEVIPMSSLRHTDL